MGRASDELKAFLDFVRESETQYLLALEVMKTEEKRTQDLLHAIEFEPHADARSKLATRMRASRIARRESKDVVEELEPIVDFMSIQSNRKVIEQLTQILGKIRKVEKYHASRTYHPRVEE